MVSMRKSRLSVYKQDRLIEHFVAGMTARCAAALAWSRKRLGVARHCASGKMSLPNWP